MRATTSPAAPAANAADARSHRWIAASIAVAVAIWPFVAPIDLAAPARASLAVLGLAIVAWAVLRWDETPVSIAAALALVAFGAVTRERLFDSLGSDLIWLLIGAFVIAAALGESGLSRRLVMAAIGSTATLEALIWKLTAVIALTAFVVPSTSARAALLLPVFLALQRSIGDARAIRALGLLFPSVILLSACASLLGAAAHLIAIDMIERLGRSPPAFVHWALLAAPFAAASSAAAALLILRLFLEPAERRRPLALAREPAAPLSRQQRTVLALILITVALWLASSWLAWNTTLIALAGALAVTLRPLTGVSMKTALRGVEWNLILFLAATMVIGEALVDSGAARWLAQSSLRIVPPGLADWAIAAAMFAIVVAMLAHLIITSRSARAAVLLPVLVFPLSAGGTDATALILLITIGSGYCQTLAISAKPVALFAKLEQPAFTDADLLRLSLWLMPAFALLLLACSTWLWPALGVALRAA